MAPEDELEISPQDRILATLDLALPPVEPPAGLWAKIEAGAPQTDAPAVSVERFARGRWRRLAPGVRVKRLWDANTLLLECEPGAVIPHHEHLRFEHAVVLSGDLVSDRATYRPGDYHGTPKGGSHDAWTTSSGCVVLVQYAA